MKELLVSNCEKNYVSKCLKDFTRLDGRAFDEFRELKIDFGRDWGCCHVSLGETRVLAQVSCEIQQPKSSRPNEGLVNINVELSPMGAPQFEAGRQSELGVHLNRLLEKCLKDSKALDLESLCIKLNEKVWALRIDVNVLNNEGNLLDCSSIAALTALAHFRRPDVTSEGEKITIHTHEQRDPISTVVHHYPVCVTYATFNQGDTCVADPSLLEEAVSEAQLVLAINSFKEICSLHLGGTALASQNLILQCASKAASRACKVVQNIKLAIEQDHENRKENKKMFFQHTLIKTNDVDLETEQLTSVLNKWEVKRSANRRKLEHQDPNRNKIKKPIINPTMKNTLDKSVILLGEGSAELLTKNSTEMDDSSDESDVQIMESEPLEKNVIDINDSSEEETVVTLNSEIKKNDIKSKSPKINNLKKH